MHQTSSSAMVFGIPGSRENKDRRGRAQVASDRQEVERFLHGRLRSVIPTRESDSRHDECIAFDSTISWPRGMQLNSDRS